MLVVVDGMLPLLSSWIVTPLVTRRHAQSTVLWATHLKVNISHHVIMMYKKGNDNTYFNKLLN